MLEGSRLADLDLGPSINESLSRAVDLQRRISACESFSLDDSSESPDALHALCRLLTEQCVDSPDLALRDAKAAREALDAQRWEFDELYEREIRLHLQAEDEGKFVVIDIDTGAYEIDTDELAASDRLLARHPAAQMWLRRVGSRYVRRFGPRDGSLAV